MIRQVKSNEYESVRKIISENKFQNPYFYMDIEKMGFFSETIDTFVYEYGENTAAFIFRYYNSLQLLSVHPCNNYSELSAFIASQRFEMVSGSKDIIGGICRHISGYHSVDGIIMKKEVPAAAFSSNCSLPEDADYPEIAELICSDAAIGGHYSIPQLTKQLLERKNESGCKNVIIRKEGKIVCHMGTYAETEDMAVLGGLITDPKFRGHGYGSETLDYLTLLVQKDGKTPLLYCFEPSTQQWYYSKGWTAVVTCSKLERDR